ncbi:hypothetical protein NBRC116598_41490 [Pseudophaeobacter arcticus]|uniref:Uncharacterized protein n=1 Tax=Pseudophaeobacter arcticus TaxID=385492 RepID=A0ABQ0AS89_9RHOB
MIEISNAQSASIVSALHSGLALPLTRTNNVEEMRLKAYVEIISDPMNAVDTLALGEAINTTIMLGCEDDVFVEPSALIELHGNRMVSCALLYAGVSPEQSNATTKWRVGRPRSDSRVLTLPTTLLQDWLSEI